MKLSNSFLCPRLWKPILWMIASLWILASCIPETPKATPIPLSETDYRPAAFDSSCSPPCWKSITPGVTTKEEAINVISSMQIKDFMEEKGDFYGYDSYIDWIFLPNHDRGRIYFKDNLVGQVKLSFSQSIQLQEAVDQFGEPELIIAQGMGGDFTYYAMIYFYPKKGIWIVNSDTDNVSGNLSVDPHDPILEITYFNPKTSEQLVDDWSAAKSSIQPWQGFGMKLKEP